MLSEDDLLKFVKGEGEDHLVDIKGPIAWDNAEASARLTKDIVAFGNSRNGGVIVIGKEENPQGGYSFTGLTEEQDASFETTKVATWVNNRFEPAISLVCYHLTHWNRRFVVIEIREFDDVPSICTRDYGDRDRILKRGSVYLRNKNAESTTMQTAEDFRELIGVAVQKKGDELLTSLTAILKGKSSLFLEPQHRRYESEIQQINEAFTDSLGSKVEQGSWRFTFHPTNYNPQLFTPESLEDRIRRNAVRVGYDEFPGSYKGYYPTEWGVYNDFYGEAFSLTNSGLFAYNDVFRENLSEFQSPWIGMQGERESIEAGKWFDYELNLVQVIQMFFFMSRFCHEYPPGTEVQYQLTAQPLRGRRLATTNSNINLDPTGASKATRFSYEMTAAADVVKVNWKEQCAEALFQLFRLFPDVHVTRETLASMIDKRLGRTG